MTSLSIKTKEQTHGVISTMSGEDMFILSQIKWNIIVHRGHNTKTNSIFIIFISLAAMRMNELLSQLYDNNVNISNYLLFFSDICKEEQKKMISMQHIINYNNLAFLTNSWQQLSNLWNYI